MIFIFPIQPPVEFFHGPFFSLMEDGEEGSAGVVHEIFKVIAFQKVDHAPVGEEDFLVFRGPAHQHGAGHAAFESSDRLKPNWVRSLVFGYGIIESPPAGHLPFSFTV